MAKQVASLGKRASRAAILNLGWAQSACDAAGNMVEMPQPNSPSTVNNVTFDAWNRLIAVSSGGSQAFTNMYDGFNRRVSRIASATTRHFYYLSRWRKIEERLGVSSTADRQFVWGLRYIDDVVLRDCSDYSPSRLYGLQDPNWNVTALVDATGTVQERYSYAGYGLPASSQVLLLLDRLLATIGKRFTVVMSSTPPRHCTWFDIGGTAHYLEGL